jgi:hypothetical protein
MISVITTLGEVPDPRTGNATRLDRLDMLVTALTASICGCETPERFAAAAPARTSPSAATASAVAGPTPSPDPSSIKMR